MRVLEQNEQACAEASAQNAGMVRSLVVNPRERALVRRSIELLGDLPGDDWDDATPFRRTGSVVGVVDPDAPVLAGLRVAATSLRSRGVAVDALEGPDVGEAAPALAGGAVSHALHVPDDGVCDAHTLGAGFVRGARRRGVTFDWNTRCLRLLRDGDRVIGVATDRGAVHAGTVVLASAAWTAHLVPEQELRPLARHLLFSTPHPLATGTHPWCWIEDVGLYLRPETGGFLVSPCDETLVPAPIGPGSTRAVDDHARALAHERIAAHLPALSGLRLRQGWVGLRTFTPSREPLVGADPARPGLFWLTALGGSGVGCSFALGEHAAAALLGEGRGGRGARMTRALRDIGIAAGLTAGFAALYLATLQGRVFGRDGAFLSEWAVLPETARENYHNVLFHRVAGAVTAAFPTEDPLLPVRALCALSVAVGVGLAFACCRALGHGRAASAWAAALLGASPAAWFFGTTVEVHALHFAIVTATALVIVAAPWQRPALGLGVACAALPLGYLSHQGAPALGFGWLLLAQCGRLRRGAAPFGWRALLGIGAAMVAALLLGQMLGNWIRGEGFGLTVGELAHAVESWQRPAPLLVAAEEVAGPLALLLGAAVAGWLLERTWRAAASAALFWPTAGFVIYWGIVERGGYVLGPAVGLAIAAAALFARAGPALRRVLIALLAVQAAAGWWTVDRFDAEGHQLEDRVAIVERLLGEEGTVVSATTRAPNMRVWLPGVQEINLISTFATPAPPASVDDWLTNRAPPQILFGLIGNRPFVLDRSYTRLGDEHWQGLFRECIEQLEAEVLKRFEVEEHPDPSWPVWLARPR